MEDKILLRHLRDLSNKAKSSGVPFYSDFLNINEISLLKTEQHEMAVPFYLYGGFETAERCVCCFNSADSYVEADKGSYPISCIHIYPKSRRFAGEVTHRDVLGALMHLQIKRELLGDIIVTKDWDIYVFCVDRIAGFITENLFKISHTDVSTEIIDINDFEYEPEFKEAFAQISSNRIDAFVAVSCHISRSEAGRLIDQEKIFINERICDSHSRELNEGDIISIRGKGKLKISQFDGMTRKGKMKVNYLWYS